MTGRLELFFGTSPRPWLAALGLLASCRASEAPKSTCEPGEERACGCSAAISGVQTCVAGGYTACRCDGDAGADAGANDPTPEAGMGELDARVVIPPEAGTPDAGVDRDASCGVQTSEATLRQVRSVDVIFAIDNSGSMSEEIRAVEDNINGNFARILDQRGADYRVIMVSDHGSSDSQQICVRAPLSETACEPIPAAPANGARFFHYDVNVQSTDAWCRLLETFDVPDPNGLTDMGWSAWLRPDSLKVFVVISDDGIYCSTARGTFQSAGSADVVAEAAALAEQFNDALLTLSPMHFGTSAEPNYVWHSVIGIEANVPPENPWTASAPLRSGVCPTAVQSAPGYQMLSIGTGGLRFPVCGGTGFSSLFRAIAAEVVAGAGVDCRFEVPEPPPGKRVDLASVVVEYNPHGGSAVERLEQVESSACDERGFVVQGSELVLCDEACSRVRADEAAKLRVVFQCDDDILQ